MNENDSEIWATLASFLDGKASDVEKETVNNWLKESDSNRQMFELLQNKKFKVRNDEAEALREKIFDKVQTKLITNNTTRTIRIWQYAAAASIALFLSVSSLYIFRSSPETIALIETKCPEGSRSTVALADGTIVELNSASTLTYPARFTGKQRIVELTGEGFFHVASNKKNPFIVKAGDLNIRVLGTQFNIKAYKEDTKIFTTLLEGSVRIEFSGNSEKFYVLNPDQQAVFDKESNRLNVQNVNAELFAVWKKGSFYFDSESLIEISRKLEREFNISITITTPELEKVLFSGVFDKGESITQILDMLRKYRNFNYRIKNNQVELYTEK
jgi:ferric-dicitrate binding protein FerR (iron transport regulator)